LVGTEGDEEVGNDSYIGALARVAQPDDLYLTKDYYAVRRHRPVSTPEHIPTSASEYAHIVDQPLRFSLQSRIVALLTQRMKAIVKPEEWTRLQNVSPRFSVQSFYLSNGGLRYYAKLDWNSHVVGNDESNDVLAAWLAPAPTLRILAVETRWSSGADLPALHNVVDLGEGRTGAIVSSFGEDSGALRLLEYRDGISLPQMRRPHETAAEE
jgi:hypothetical protein